MLVALETLWSSIKMKHFWRSHGDFVALKDDMFSARQASGNRGVRSNRFVTEFDEQLFKPCFGVGWLHPRVPGGFAIGNMNHVGWIT